MMIIKVTEKVFYFTALSVMQMAFCGSVYGVQSSVVISDETCKISTYKHDNKPSLDFQMIQHKHISGAAYAVDFEVLNATDHDIIIKVHEEIKESIHVAISLNKAHGTTIAESKIRIDSIKSPYTEIVIQRGNAARWLFSLKDMLKTDSVTKAELASVSKGLFMVFFPFEYRVKNNECDKEYKKAKFSVWQDGYFSLESYTPLSLQ